jgi:hypothetical protein
MPRYLRSVKTRYYYAYGQWMPNIHHAQVFPDTYAAVQEYIRERLHDVKVLMQMGEVPSAYDFCVKLGPYSGER